MEDIPLLAELSRTVGDGPFRLRALVGFVRRGVAHSREVVRPLTALRRSFFRSWLVVCAPLAAFAVFLVFTAPPVAAAIAVGVQAVHAAGVFAFTYLQLDLVRNDEGRTYERFGAANALTVLRILYAPSIAAGLMLAGGHPELRMPALVAYAFVALSDVLDGMVARATGSTSIFGRYYDPLGDMLLLPLSSLGLSVAGVVPWWLTGIILYRYWAVAAIGTTLYIVRGPFPIRPTWIGKMSGFLLGWVLGAGVLRLCFEPSWLPPAVMNAGFAASALLSGANVLYLTVRGLTLTGRRPWPG